MMSRDEKKAAFILAAIAVVEGMWCLANVRHPSRFLAYMGFLGASAPVAGWVLATLVFVAFTAFAARLPSVRVNLFRPSWLKILGLAVAVTACFVEEAVFRKLLMDGMQRGRYSVASQILVSGVLFGAAHGIWGAFRGSIAAAMGAVVVTGLLGAALGVVYVASDRILAPCIVAHFFINALAEPGLVLAAVRGEMSTARLSGLSG